MRTTTTCTLGALKAQQVIWPEWMAQHTAGLSDTDLVDVTRSHLGAMGSFVLAIRPHQPGQVTA